MDRCILELQLDGEEAYQTFQRVIENANVIMATYEDLVLGDVMVYPEKGTIAFSAGLHGWAFTLTNFAKMFFAFGHVFAGKVSTGSKVRIMGPNFAPAGGRTYAKRVSRELFIWMGKKRGESVEDVPCGYLMGLVRLDQFITKNTTLTNEKEVEAHPIHAMKFSVSLSFRETVFEKSGRSVMSKSPNKHNRLYMEARPLDYGLTMAIEDGRIGPRDDPKVRSMILSEEFGWDNDLAKKIWCFGPETTGPNMVVDKCRGVQYLNEIKDSVVAGFQWDSKESALADEEMRGICFEITAKPGLLEPVYMVEIQAPEHALSCICGVLNQKRGYVFEEMQIPGTPLYNIKAYLPVLESFGFSGQLRAATSGLAFTEQCVLDLWDLVISDPLEIWVHGSNPCVRDS
ncbi:hypothetical protein IFM89_027272 [Coptis chinensis]|uniref:Elongation factor 2 n=1 Tax=Coptis chinensis TaxID=261450 RepID=A0A835IPF7_9MAGN|nr:hypothetical protein IFM89_027272 [Coptis chinensis]